MSAPKVQAARHKHGHVTECEQCSRFDPDSTREQCRAHVRASGHTVRYLIEDVTVYKQLADRGADAT